MQVGMVGLGRMGLNMARRLLRRGHMVVAWNRTAAKAEALAGEGAVAAQTLPDLVARLASPRVIWLMLPAGEVVDRHLEALAPLLDPGDILVDGGNSWYRDDIRRADALAARGLGYLDAGVSGGVWGLELGYCTMVGGAPEVVRTVEPILADLAPEGGWLHCGGPGAGHFVKMVHNGVEYALMEAYGEGFEIIRAGPYGGGLDLADVAALWDRGSVVRSWLLELLERAFRVDPELKEVSGYVEDSGEGRWTVQQAVETGVSAVGIAHALMKRFQSRQEEVFSDKVLAALRREFGGHAVDPPAATPRRTGGRRAGAGTATAARPHRRRRE